VVDTAGGHEALVLTAMLRASGLSADRAFDRRSMRSQLKSADRSGARLALIIGEEELAAGTVAVRDLRGEGQETVARTDVVDHVRERLARP
jgi:histidyl-tRNA synthetase